MNDEPMNDELKLGRSSFSIHHWFGMRFYSFQIVIEKEPEDEGYLAYSPTVPGCFSNGKTIEETPRNLREAVEQHIASLLAHGAGSSRRPLDGVETGRD